MHKRQKGLNNYVPDQDSKFSPVGSFLKSGTQKFQILILTNTDNLGSLDSSFISTFVHQVIFSDEDFVDKGCSLTKNDHC